MFTHEDLHCRTNIFLKDQIPPVLRKYTPIYLVPMTCSLSSTCVPLVSKPRHLLNISNFCSHFHIPAPLPFPAFFSSFLPFPVTYLSTFLTLSVFTADEEREMYSLSTPLNSVTRLLYNLKCTLHISGSGSFY